MKKQELTQEQRLSVISGDAYEWGIRWISLFRLCNSNLDYFADEVKKILEYKKNNPSSDWERENMEKTIKALEKEFNTFVESRKFQENSKVEIQTGLWQSAISAPNRDDSPSTRRSLNIEKLYELCGRNLNLFEEELNKYIKSKTASAWSNESLAWIQKDIDEFLEQVKTFVEKTREPNGSEKESVAKKASLSLRQIIESKDNLQ